MGRCLCVHYPIVERNHIRRMLNSPAAFRHLLKWLYALAGVALLIRFVIL